MSVSFSNTISQAGSSTPSSYSTSSQNANAATAMEQAGLSKDDFLTLLTKQLSYQDPMEPMKNEDFVAQLAQFSSLEQMSNMNDALEESIAMQSLTNQSITNSLATGLIGKSVKAQYNQVSLTYGENIDFNYITESAAKQLTLRIYNENGQLVRTEEMYNIGKGEHVYNWNGKDDLGNGLPSGSYTFELEGVDASDNAVTALGYLQGEVNGIRYEGSGAVIRVGNQTISFGDVYEIGNP